MQGFQLVDSHKSTLVDLYTVQRAIPARTKKTQPEPKETSKPKTHNHNQNKQEAQRSGIATSNGSNMHDDLLCVIENGHRTRRKTKKTRNHTKDPGKRVMEATKLNAETRDPPSQDPRDHESSHSGITFTLALRSKHRQRRVATRVVKNE